MPSWDPTYPYKGLSPGRLDRGSPDLQASGFFSGFCIAGLQLGEPMTEAKDLCGTRSYSSPEIYLCRASCNIAQAGLELTMLARTTVHV